VNSCKQELSPSGSNERGGVDDAPRVPAQRPRIDMAGTFRMLASAAKGAADDATLAPRRRSLVDRTVLGHVTGNLVDWKGQFGWIEASNPIDHPMASKHQGRVYLAQEDVTEELSGIGALVSFTLYADSDGLGATDCRMADRPAAKKAPMRPSTARPAAKKAPVQSDYQAKPVSKAKAAKPAPAEPASASPASAAPTNSAAEAVAELASREKLRAWSAPESASADGADADNFPADGQSREQRQSKGRPKGKGHGKHDGIRKHKLLTEEPLLGVVCQLKDAHGWITPSEPFHHPSAHRHKGDLYFNREDFDGVLEGEGALVQFMVYQDKKGLGASHVSPAPGFSELFSVQSEYVEQD